MFRHVYVATIRYNYTLCLDMYTLQLYTAIIRSARYAYMCIFKRIRYQCNTYMCKTCPNMLHKYVLFKHVYVAGIRWNYTLHKYVLFRHLYVPDIRCNHTFYFNVYTLRIYVATIRCNYTLFSTCIRCNYTLQLYVRRDTRICAFSNVYVTSATHICVKLVRICSINTFFSSMYTLRVYTLELYVA